MIDEGEEEPRFVNGVQQIADLLAKSDDLDLLKKYGFWLLRRDRNLGLSVSYERIIPA
jgi:hypothetical protein